MKIFYDFNARDIKGVDHSMSEYKSKVVLVVNVASNCGFTSQYEGLQELYNIEFCLRSKCVPQSP